MVDWLGGKKVGRWNKYGYLFTAYFIGVFGFALAAMIMVMIVSIYDLAGLVMVPLGLVGCSVVIWGVGVFWRRSNKWIKVFNFKDEIVVKVIDNALRNEKLLYRRLSQEGPVKRFPVNYAEIFIIENSKIEILVEKQMVTGSFVEIGPIFKNSDDRLELLKNRIDDAFIPKGL